MLYALILLANMLVANGEEKPPDGLAPFGSMLLPMILIFAALYFLMIRPAQRRERQQRELLFTTLKKNDKVLTSAGIIGIVADLKDDEAILKIDESANVRLRILRSSIVRILTAKEQGKDSPAEPAK